MSKRPDLANLIRGTPIVIYDFVGKLGDWLFKQPLILSLSKSGYKVSGSSNNPFPLGLSSNAVISKSHTEFAFALTSSRNLSAVKKLIRERENVVEFRRLGRFSEAILYWHHGTIIFKKKFRKAYEQERVEAMVRFMGLRFEEEQIEIERPENKLIALNFNVGENNTGRLHFRTKEVLKFVRYAAKNSYICILIRKKGKPTILLEKKLIEARAYNVQVKETKSIKAACSVIDKCAYYFGADTGLGHYAVRKGKIVFSLYNSGYHGLRPLFNSTYYNHLIFFGDYHFSKNVINILKSLERKNFLSRARNLVKSFLESRKRTISSGSHNNREKLSRLVLWLAVHEFAVEQIMESAKGFFSGIFFPDRIHDISYGKARMNSGKIFIDSQQFVSRIEKLLNDKLGARKKKVSIFAKNSSFFYGTALKRSVSDIDLMTVVAPLLSGSERKMLLQKMNWLLKEHGFSVAFPHQVPVAVQKLIYRNQYRCIIKNGFSSFLRSTPTDMENVEKYKSRVKLLIILGEISEEELHALLRRLEKERFFGKVFIREINALCKQRKKFLKYQIFIRKMENILAGVGGFGSRGGILLRFSTKEQRAWKGVIEDLMAHGIIYIVGNRLYVNWDIRRPQHAWFIPIALKWEVYELGRIAAKAIKSPLYKRGLFKTLKELKLDSISTAKAVNLLTSQSHLVITEAFRYLRRKMSFLKEKHLITRREIEAYLRVKNSNCNVIEEKKIDLLGLATGKPLSFSTVQVARLSKYNLFIYYLNIHRHFDINATSFFNIKNVAIYHSAGEFQKDFIAIFLKLLREYYLYKISGSGHFFLLEKRKEILFNYFVRGRNLIEGPKGQQKKIIVFLKKIDLSSLFTDEKYLEVLIASYHNNFLGEDGDFLISWAIRRALIKHIS